jgi:acetyl-CoA acetyltransferase
VTRHAAITGAAVTRVGELPGRSTLGLHLEAARAAADDAGLALEDLDGVLCAYSLAEPHPMLASAFCEHAALQPAFSAVVQAGGASAATMVVQAAALVRAGQCRHVLCVTGDNRATGMRRDDAVAALAQFGHPAFERPFGLAIYAAYALVAQRYMHEHGTTTEDLAAIAVAHRRHAARHPLAHRREPITVDDVMASRTIASPLRLLDCCQVSDGAAAVIVSAPDAASDGRAAPVRLLGAGQGHTHEHVVAAPSLTHFGCREAAARAFGQAGLDPAEVDVAQIYDSFTITLVVELESMGFFQPGEAGRAAAAGALDLGGRLPCNTHGGLLSFGHSGAAGGMFHVVEAVAQLRGEADARQVPGARTAFVHGDGGILSAHCSLVLARD